MLTKKQLDEIEIKADGLPNEQRWGEIQIRRLLRHIQALQVEVDRLEGLWMKHEQTNNDGVLLDPKSLLDENKTLQEEVDNIEIKTVRNARVIQCMFCHSSVIFETEPFLIGPLNWGHHHKYEKDLEPAPCAAGPLWEYEKKLLERKTAPPDR